MKKSYLFFASVFLATAVFAQQNFNPSVFGNGNILLQDAASLAYAASGQVQSVDNPFHHYTEYARMRENEMARYRMQAAILVPSTGTDYDVKYYRLELRINPDTVIGKYIRGKVTTYFTNNTANFNKFNVDFATPLNCDSVYYHNARIPAGNIIRPIDLLQIFIPPIGTIGTLDSITIFYKGVPPVVPYFGNGTGYVKAVHNSTQNYVYTLSEPYSSYTWWPCKSFVVNDKADSMDMIVSAPVGFKTAGNGTLVSETSNGSDITTYWKERYPIAAYQVCTAVANYEQYPAIADTVMIGSTKMPVYNYLFPETNRANAHTSLDRVKLMLTTFSAKFGDYPFKNEKYGNYTFGFGGGMEHNTFSGESATGVYNQPWYWDILAHELGHQWFGGSVTNGSWGDIWINESFATFTEAICAEFAPSISAAAGQTAVSWRGYHKGLAINPSNQIQSVYVADTSNMATIFTPAVYVYERGAMVIYMLRTLMGDAKFFQAIQNFQADPVLKYRNAITDDVKRHMEAVSGLDLATFFNQWIYNTGFAKYSGATWNNAANHIVLRMPQTVQSSALTHFDMPVAVRIQGSNPATMDTTVILYDQAGTLYYDDNGMLTSAGGNIVQFNLSFIPVTITFDAFNQVLASGTFAKDPALTVVAAEEFVFSGAREGNNAALSFSIPNAADYTSFEIEKSTDATSFKK